MTHPTIHIGAVAALAVALAGIAASTGMANPSTTQCGVVSKTEGGMLALEGTVLSPVATTGEYRFSIRSSSGGGSSNISQGGTFVAEANKPTAIGKVMVNAGSKVDIDFTVTANGQRLDCSQELASLI